MKYKNVASVEHINLKEIKNPDFLKSLSYPELNLLASDIRKEIIECTSNNGGHLSGNLGVVELTIALERFFDLSKDKIIFDVGHQSYTHKILTGRDLTKLRKTNGIEGFQKLDESPYDVYECGHSSTSISAANGFAIARDMNHENHNVVAFIGDGSIVNGLALEALNNLIHSNSKVFIILNDNGMSISKPVGALSKMFARISTDASYVWVKKGYRKLMTSTKLGKKIYDFSASIKNRIKGLLVSSNLFSELGYSYVGPVDGHDIKAITKALKRASRTQKSVVVHVCTLKGKGYSYAENDTNGYWHGVGPFDIESGEPKNKHVGERSWSTIFSYLTEEEMENHEKSILISPATLVGSCLDRIIKNEKLKNRVIDVGIAEEHAVTLASGLSINGYHPIISIYSTFMQRSYDQISHDLARMNLNATFLVDRAGLVGQDGDTHQGIYDEAYLSTIPNIVVTMPSTPSEAKLLFDESFNNHGCFFIRLPRCYVKDQEMMDLNLPYGSWMKLFDDPKQKLAIIGVGPLLRELQSELSKARIKCTLINALYVNPVDEKMLSSLLGYSKIVIYNPYSTRGGLVSNVTSYLLDHKFKGAISAYFIPNEFVRAASIDEQLEKYNLLPTQIVDLIKAGK